MAKEKDIQTQVSEEEKEAFIKKGEEILKNPNTEYTPLKEVGKEE